MTPSADRYHQYAYPRLSGSGPVLVRGDAELQIGMDREPALVLSGVHPQLIDVLTQLDGQHALTEIEAEALRLGIPDAHLSWCLTTLHEAGLLAERGQQLRGRGPLHSSRLRLVGAGRIATPVAKLLSSSPIAALYVVDNTAPDPSLQVTAGAVGSQAEALVAALEPTSGVPMRVVNHWSKPEGVAPDLTIVASDHLECDRVVADGLLRADQPHLFVRAAGGGVVVGPFVVPGRTACLHCTDLARRDADAAWPVLLSQLARTRTRVSPAQVAWAGAVTVAQALAYLSGAEPETVGATIELSAVDHLTRWRSWGMHPACGCGWGPEAEWGP